MAAAFFARRLLRDPGNLSSRWGLARDASKRPSSKALSQSELRAALPLLSGGKTILWPLFKTWKVMYILNYKANLVVTSHFRRVAFGPCRIAAAALHTRARTAQKAKIARFWFRERALTNCKTIRRQAQFRTITFPVHIRLLDRWLWLPIFGHLISRIFRVCFLTLSWFSCIG